MNCQPLDIRIISEADLLRALDLLHDGGVREEEIIYNASDRVLDIIIERINFEEKNIIEIKHIFPFVKKYSYPIIKSHLHLSNINSFKKESKDTSLRVHTFNECRIKNNKYTLVFCEVLRIELSFLDNEPSGFMKDIGIIKDRRVSSISLFKK